MPHQSGLARGVREAGAAHPLADAAAVARKLRPAYGAASAADFSSTTAAGDERSAAPTHVLRTSSGETVNLDASRCGGVGMSRSSTAGTNRSRARRAARQPLAVGTAGSSVTSHHSETITRNTVTLLGSSCDELSLESGDDERASSEVTDLPVRRGTTTSLARRGHPAYDSPPRTVGGETSPHRRRWNRGTARENFGAPAAAEADTAAGGSWDRHATAGRAGPDRCREDLRRQSPPGTARPRGRARGAAAAAAAAGAAAATGGGKPFADRSRATLMKKGSGTGSAGSGGGDRHADWLETLGARRPAQMREPPRGLADYPEVATARLALTPALAAPAPPDVVDAIPCEIPIRTSEAVNDALGIILRVTQSSVVTRACVAPAANTTKTAIEIFTLRRRGSSERHFPDKKRDGPVKLGAAYASKSRLRSAGNFAEVPLFTVVHREQSLWCRQMKVHKNILFAARLAGVAPPADLGIPASSVKMFNSADNIQNVHSYMERVVPHLKVHLLAASNDIDLFWWRAVKNGLAVLQNSATGRLVILPSADRTLPAATDAVKRIIELLIKSCSPCAQPRGPEPSRGLALSSFYEHDPRYPLSTDEEDEGADDGPAGGRSPLPESDIPPLVMEWAHSVEVSPFNTVYIAKLSSFCNLRYSVGTDPVDPAMILVQVHSNEPLSRGRQAFPLCMTPIFAASTARRDLRVAFLQAVHFLKKLYEVQLQPDGEGGTNNAPAAAAGGSAGAGFASVRWATPAAITSRRLPTAGPTPYAGAGSYAGAFATPLAAAGAGAGVGGDFGSAAAAAAAASPSTYSGTASGRRGGNRPTVASAEKRARRPSEPFARDAATFAREVALFAREAALPSNDRRLAAAAVRRKETTAPPTAARAPQTKTLRR